MRDALALRAAIAARPEHTADERRDPGQEMRYITLAMLTGKVAIVTGGARGIGAGIARVMAAQGARVALLDLDVVEAEKTATTLRIRGDADGSVGRAARAESSHHVRREQGRPAHSPRSSRATGRGTSPDSGSPSTAGSPYDRHPESRPTYRPSGLVRERLLHARFHLRRRQILDMRRE
jgi:hypothetical protein